MTYEGLISTVSEIINNEKISTRGLTLNYTLDYDDFNNLRESLAIINGVTKSDYDKDSFSNEFDVTYNGLVISFTLKDKNNK